MFDSQRRCSGVRLLEPLGFFVLKVIVSDGSSILVSLLLSSGKL